MSHPGVVEAINASDLTKIGIGITVVLVVIGVLLGLLITAIIGRVIIAVIVIGLAVFVWVERGSVENRIAQESCPPNLSFFGLHLDAPQDYKQFCHDQKKKSRHPGQSQKTLKTHG